MILSSKSAIQHLLEIDKSITSNLINYEDLSANLEFLILGLVGEVERSKILNLKYPGLYMFEISSNNELNFSKWLDKFKPIWEDDRYKKLFTPNTRKKRIAAHRNKDLGEWIPLYIGKSENVGGRIMQHLELEMKKPTNALKINSRDNISDYKFRLSTIKIEVTNYASLMFISESVMRDKLNPITGKQ